MLPPEKIIINIAELLAMQKHLLIFFFSYLCFLSAFSQEKREKEAHYTYLSLGSSVYTNAIGSFDQKVFMSAEVGRSFGIFDIGVAVGRLNFVKAGDGLDSNWFVEVVPTINVFSKGRFSEALSLGAGRIFNRKENFLTEITNSINFAANDKFIITVFQGNYFFDGRLSTSHAQFMGLSMTYNFIRQNSENEIKRRKSLLN